MTRDRFISEVRACQGQLRRFLASLCGDSALADDIAQEALVRAYVSSGSFTGNFKAWLFRIAYNSFIDNLLAMKRPITSFSAFLRQLDDQNLKEKQIKLLIAAGAFDHSAAGSEDLAGVVILLFGQLS